MLVLSKKERSRDRAYSGCVTQTVPPEFTGENNHFLCSFNLWAKNLDSSRGRWLVSAPLYLVPVLKSFKSGNGKRLGLGSKHHSHLSDSTSPCWLLSRDASVPHHVTSSRCPPSGFLPAGRQGKCRGPASQEKKIQAETISPSLAWPWKLHSLNFDSVLLAEVVLESQPGSEGREIDSTF